MVIRPCRFLCFPLIDKEMFTKTVSLGSVHAMYSAWQTTNPQNTSESGGNNSNHKKSGRLGKTCKHVYHVVVYRKTTAVRNKGKSG